MANTITINLNDTQLAMLEAWRSVQPVELNEADAAKALMIAGLLMVDGAFKRDGKVGALWTGADAPGLH